jgi:hypothetical protein
VTASKFIVYLVCIRSSSIHSHHETNNPQNQINIDSKKKKGGAVYRLKKRSSTQLHHRLHQPQNQYRLHNTVTHRSMDAARFKRIVQELFFFGFSGIGAPSNSQLTPSQLFVVLR